MKTLIKMGDYVISQYFHLEGFDFKLTMNNVLSKLAGSVKNLV